MNKILLYLVESGVGLLVFYLLYALMLRRENGFTYNRFYLLLTPLVALILPLMEWPLFFQAQPEPRPLALFVAEPVAPITSSNTVAAALPPGPEALPEAPLFDLAAGLLLLYLAGVSFFLFRLGRQLYCLHLFTQQTQPGRFYWQAVPVHKTGGAQPTFSFLNRIYWDNSQPVSPTEMERIFRHEAVHIQQRHSWDILYLELLKSIFWFNPLLHFYQKAITSTHEFIADAVVLRTTDPETYANLLVKQLFHRLEFSFGNYFNKPLLLRRLQMMKQTRRPSIVKQLMAFPLLGGLVFLLSSTNPPVTEPTHLAYPFYPAKQTTPFPPQSFSEPLFPGGKEAMYNFLAQNIKYPAEGIDAIGSGTSMLMAMEIDEKGFLKIPEYTTRQDNPLPTVSPVPLDKEIHRILAAMPTQWVPATVNDRPVASRYIFRFNFFKSNPAEKITEITEKESYEFDSDNKPVVISRPIYAILYDPNIPVEPRRDRPTISYYNPKTTIQTAAATSGSVQTIASLAYDNKVQFPLFPGGHRNMYKYMRNNVQFDEHIHFLGNNTAGAFTAVEIKVDEKGRVTPVTSSNDDVFAREINEAIRRMPAWQPAEVDGKPTAATYFLTLAFKKDYDEYKVGSVWENLEKYTGGALKINAVLFGKKAYVVENNPNEPVLTVVEKKPEFPGGMDKMYAFLNRNIKYPPAARDAKLEGMVQAKFIVTKEGRLLETRIEEHLNPETDAELLRVIQQMPRWTPGKQNGQPVNVEYTLPFKFRLDD